MGIKKGRRVLADMLMMKPIHDAKIGAYAANAAKKMHDTELKHIACE